MLAIMGLLFCVCLLLGALAAYLLHRFKHPAFVCYVCGDEAEWVWRIDHEERYICDWHNAQMQVEFRGNGPIRREPNDGSAAS